jgi:hypothetical protein
MKKLIMIAVIMQLIPGIADCMLIKRDNVTYSTGTRVGVRAFRNDEESTERFRQKNTCVRRFVCFAGMRFLVTAAEPGLGINVWFPSSVQVAEGRPRIDQLSQSAASETKCLAFESDSALRELGKHSAHYAGLESAVLPAAVSEIKSYCFEWN